MENTGTASLPLALSHQERQLVAGRYRLAAFHRGDESTEVWRALDEAAHQVVSLEFLRDPDPASKERFLAAGRRMASVQQPSVMKVAAVHDGADGTFIVFEHLVHIPVPLEWLKLAVEPAPATPAPAVATTAIADAPPVAPPPLPALAPAPPPAPAMAAAPAAPEVPAERQTDRGLSLLLYALRTREMSLIDQPLLEESAFEFLAAVRASFEDVHFDPTVLDDIASGLRRVANPVAIVSAPVRLVSGLAKLVTIRPSLHLPTPRMRVAVPRVSRSAAAPAVRAESVAKVKPVKVPKVKPVKIKAVAEPKAPRAARAPSRFFHVRWSRVLTRGLVLGVLAAAIVVMPQELMGNAGNVASEIAGNAGTVASEIAGNVGNVAGNIANQVTTQIGERLTPPASGLERASFEVPPLSAYRASFESQAPYPTAHPNATVEWVVALRNTGSVGWYRGIDGAQASIALPDGTLAGVQTTAYVGPGQVGWFVLHFTAPAELGTSKIALRPRIDGRGQLPDLGLYAMVTVTPNP